MRQTSEDKVVTYDIRGRKLEGHHECQVWSAKEIRCSDTKTDGTAQRQFMLDRESLRVRDQSFTRGRSLTEEITFEGECKQR